VVPLCSQVGGASIAPLVDGAPVATEERILTKRKRLLAQLRNLPQYRNKTDVELEEIRNRIEEGGLTEQAAEVVATFEKDYDLTDMTANDRLSLTELAKVSVMLEDLTNIIHMDMKKGNDVDWQNIDRMNRIAASLRDDASKLQRDLDITRKARKGAGGTGVVDFIEDLKVRAKKFLEDRLASIFCPKCNMLVCKVWFLHPDEKSSVRIHCGRNRCRHQFTVKATDIDRLKNVKVGPPV